MSIPINLELHKRYLNIILGELDYKELNDDVLLNLTKLLDSDETTFHVEKRCVYKISAWRKSLERRELVAAKMKAKMKEIAGKIDNIKDTLELLALKIMETLSLNDREIANQLAYNIYRKKLYSQAIYMGVDISKLPELEQPHQVIEGNKYYNL